MSGKTAGMRVRVEPALHRDFVTTCRSVGKPASEVIREFMEAYVRQYATGKQADLLFNNEGSYDKGNDTQ